MARKKDENSKGSKASALLKTMGRGSPRTRAPEAPPEITQDTGQDAKPEETSGVTATEPVGKSEAHQTEEREAQRSQPGAATTPKRRKRPAKPVRITVDLDAGRHRFLRGFAYREDARGTEIVRALLDELGSDEDLVERVRIRLDNMREAS